MHEMTNIEDIPKPDRQPPRVAEPPPVGDPREPRIRDPNPGEPPLPDSPKPNPGDPPSPDSPKPNHPARPIKEPPRNPGDAGQSHSG